MKLVYRSVYIPNNLNPWWEPVSVDIDALCEGKRNKVFRILVFDHESDGKHDLMGVSSRYVVIFISLFLLTDMIGSFFEPRRTLM